MELIESIENATDEEIVETGNKIAGRIVKKFIIGVAVSVAVHFVSEFAVAAIEKKRNPEETE